MLISMILVLLVGVLAVNAVSLRSRNAQYKQTIEYPLEAEVRSLYASEYAKGKALVDAMNTYLDRKSTRLNSSH